MGLLNRNKEKKQEEKPKTQDEAIQELAKGVKNLNLRMGEQEKKQEEKAKEVKKQKEVKKEKAKLDDSLPTFIVQKYSVKEKMALVNISDPDKPVVYGDKTALALILNKLEKIEKALA